MSELTRDLRASLREFLTLGYGLSYDQCQKISEEFCDFLIDYTDDNLEVISSNGKNHVIFAKSQILEFSKGALIKNEVL